MGRKQPCFVFRRSLPGAAWIGMGLPENGLLLLASGYGRGENGAFAAGYCIFRHPVEMDPPCSLLYGGLRLSSFSFCSLKHKIPVNNLIVSQEKLFVKAILQDS